MNMTFKQGIQDCIPTLLGYISIGVAAGVIGKASNLSILEVTLLAVIVYAGAAQFIIAGLVMIGTPISAVIFTVFLVNSRHFLMSMATAPYFKQYSLWNNVAIGSLLTDESFGVAMNAISAQKPINDRWMHGLNLSAYVVWIFACFIGALIGNWLPNPEQFGLDYALVAMFAGLLYLQLMSDNKSKRNKYIVILSVGLMVVLFMPIMSAELSVLTATLIGCAIGVWLER